MIVTCLSYTKNTQKKACCFLKHTFIGVPWNIDILFCSDCYIFRYYNLPLYTVKTIDPFHHAASVFFLMRDRAAVPYPLFKVRPGDAPVDTSYRSFFTPATRFSKDFHTPYSIKVRKAAQSFICHPALGYRDALCWRSLYASVRISRITALTPALSSWLKVIVMT